MLSPHTLLSPITNALREKVFPELLLYLKKQNYVDQKNLDELVLNFFRKHHNPSLPKGYSLQFLPPYDPNYRQATGRTHHDFICKGRHTPTGTPIEIWINNKLGELSAKRRNDVTTYNNLLRLYLDITESRLIDISLPDTTLEAIRRRLENREIVAYGILAISKNLSEYNFFLLEQIGEPFYINPRNTMLQVSYKPKLRENIMSYKDLLLALFEAIKESLNKTRATVEEELRSIDNIMGKINEIINS